MTYPSPHTLADYTTLIRRMEAADAERELHAWTSLCDDFHREFCPEAKIRGPRIKNIV